MPQVGFGTWGVKDADVDTVIRAAVASGYRHFDCSPLYKNEKAVGDTLAALIGDGTLTRESIFLTSKLPPADACDRERTMHTARQTLRDLRVASLDLYLVHWPLCVLGPPPLCSGVRPALRLSSSGPTVQGSSPDQLRTQ